MAKAAKSSAKNFKDSLENKAMKPEKNESKAHEKAEAKSNKAPPFKAKR